jgi:hypothetical protein
LEFSGRYKNAAGDSKDYLPGRKQIFTFVRSKKNPTGKHRLGFAA